jgi:ABC-type phosphate/phosphonate transport system substrate-binding protein
MFKKMGLVLAALAMVLAACGGGGGLSAAEQAKADEIKAELIADQSAENVFANEAEAACFSEGLVKELGLDRINALDTGGGVEAGFANMTAAEQEKVADVAIDCIDFPAMIKDQMAAAGLDEATANCVAEGLDDDLVKALFLAQISGADPTANEGLTSVLMGCLLGG